MRSKSKSPLLSWMAPLWFVFLGFALSSSLGHFRSDLVCECSVLFLLFVAAQFVAQPKEISAALWALIAILFSAKLWHQPRVLYGQSGIPMTLIEWSLATAFVAIVVAAVPVLFPSIRSGSTYLSKGLPVAILAILAAHVLVPMASPQPKIDVFVTLTMGADHLLAGRNLYAQVYPDIYHGAFDYHPAIAYFPGGIYLMTLFRLVFGDVRYALVFADAVTALGLYGLCRRLGRTSSVSLWVSLVWLCFPISLFVMEEAWLDPFLCMGAVLMALGLLSRRWILAGVALGFLVSAKQYGVLVIPLTSFWLYRRREGKGIIIFLGVALVVCLALILPLALSSPAAFYESTIRQILSQNFRADSFSLVALFYRWHLFLPNKLVLGIYASTLGLVLLYLWRREGTLVHWASSMTILWGVVFLFGKQAFANYYYFLAIFLIVYLASSPRRSLT